MAAAVATQRALSASAGIEHLTAMGQRLRDGLDRLARRAGVGLCQTGPVQMPMVLFDDDADNAKGRAFCSAALQAGAYFHPRHSMFLCAAHQAEDIDRALLAAEAGFDVLVKLSKSTA